MPAEALTKFDWEQALEVGNACNLCGVAQSFARVMIKILNNSKSGTDEANRHPIAVLYAEQIAWLTTGSSPDFTKSFEARNKIEETLANWPATEAA